MEADLNPIDRSTAAEPESDDVPESVADDDLANVPELAEEPDLVEVSAELLDVTNLPPIPTSAMISGIAVRSIRWFIRADAPRRLLRVPLFVPLFMTIDPRGSDESRWEPWTMRRAGDRPQTRLCAQETQTR